MIRKLAALLGVCMALSGTAAQTRVEDFLAAPEFSNLKLSPDGKMIGILGHRDNADFWFRIDVETMQPLPGPSIQNLRVQNFWWKGNDQVLFQLSRSSYFELYDLKTKKFREQSRLNRVGGSILNPLVGDPENMLVTTGTSTGVDLQRLNLRTGKLQMVEKNPGWVFRWLTNREGKAVAAVGREDDTWFVLTRTAGAKEWKRHLFGEKRSPDFSPISVFRDQRRLIGWDNLSADTATLVTWDPETGEKTKLFHSDDVDPRQNITWGEDLTLVRGVAYETDRIRAVYFDAADEKLAASIDAALPGTTNFVTSSSADESRLIITATSETSPPRFYLLDRKAGKLASLGDSRPRLEGVQLASSRYLSFKARDGLPLTARLTLPREAKGKPPAILFCGDDLSTRARNTFSPIIQLLASRGYAVLFVNHRGKEEFGRKFATAADFQVDGSMTSDLADAVRYASDQGLIDPQRVAIYGRDEGGVLALHTLLNHPELFCAWLNVETPIDREALGLNSLVFGEVKLQNDFFSQSLQLKLQQYKEKIDPARHIARVRTISFHYYSHSSSEGTGHKIPAALKRSGTKFVYHVGAMTPIFDGDTSIKDYEKFRLLEEVKCYEQLLAFLDEHVAQTR